ncbi:uncharacterized protein L201_003979 [Kwoniella dendrophila CBS 6074]|uniref:Uncharacterized protein n=1 Tax=Kwoniella dendrophila CBS 6074 TaxID=1295534 RepID=A0AAX4JV12_9TREE
MPSPKITHFTHLLENDNESDYFVESEGGVLEYRSSDGFQEMIAANLMHFSEFQNTLEDVCQMWKKCYHYIASSLIIGSNYLS